MRFNGIKFIVLDCEKSDRQDENQPNITIFIKLGRKVI